VSVSLRQLQIDCLPKEVISELSENLLAHAEGRQLIDPYAIYQHLMDLLAEIREIRASERRFYQKITDIYATAMDYSVKSETTQTFFAMVQNKLHFAIHGHTAAELIVDRADSTKDKMGLTTWRNAPNGKILKPDGVDGSNRSG